MKPRPLGKISSDNAAAISKRRHIGRRQRSVDSNPPRPSPAAPAPVEQAARPVFEPGYRSTPKAVAQRLRLAGLTEGEIVGFGAEDASELSAAAAKRAARLGEHFSARDMKSLGSFLEQSGLVMNDDLAQLFMDGVPPGELSDALKSIDIAEARTAQTDIAVEADADQGVNVDERGVKAKKPSQAGKEVPPWRQAEIDLKPVLESKFGPGWETATRFHPKLADKGELLGSTVPEYYREATSNQPAMAFEVKRFNLEEMGIGRDGKVTAAPSKRTVEALLRAQLQLASRKWNLPQGTEQNIVFNITGQGVTDVSAVGETISGLLKRNSIDYGNVYVQDGNTLTQIRSSDLSEPASTPALDTTPANAAATVPPETPTFKRIPTPPDPGANIKMLSKAEIKELQKSGFDVHAEKGKDNAARSDLYKDPDGNVWAKWKGGSGEAEFTGWNLKNLKR